MAHFVRGQGRRWPNGVIPYKIEIPETERVSREEVEEGIRYWNDRSGTKIRLVAVAEGENPADYIVFVEAARACGTFAGKIGGRQEVTCDLSSDDFGAGSVIHEIGHVVGFLHEHQRPDRDQFIKVLSDGSQYRVREGGLLVTSYDLCSVMHYPASSRLEVIADMTNLECRRVGQRSGLSRLDVQAVNQVYGDPD